MTNIYVDGFYGEQNPDWHSVDSGWKARQIKSAIHKNGIEFGSCVEVGCGAGLILEHLAEHWPDRTFIGYDISPDAANFWRRRPSRLAFHQADFATTNEFHDLLLLIDVFEHIEDYLGFLRKLNKRAKWFIFHIPLDMHVSGLLRDRQIHARAKVGHLHYFSRATARATLHDVGYEIVDEVFTRGSMETVEGQRLVTPAVNVLRRIFEIASTSFTAKLLGGYSLLVVARRRET